MTNRDGARLVAALIDAVIIHKGKTDKDGSMSAFGQGDRGEWGFFPTPATAGYLITLLRTYGAVEFPLEDANGGHEYYTIALSRTITSDNPAPDETLIKAAHGGEMVCLEFDFDELANYLSGRCEISSAQYDALRALEPLLDHYYKGAGASEIHAQSPSPAITPHESPFKLKMPGT